MAVVELGSREAEEAVAPFNGRLTVAVSNSPRSTVLAGAKLYMGPIVLGVSFALVLSAAALTPGIDRSSFAAVAAIVAAWGLVRGLMSTVGIRKLGKDVHWTDLWFYGVLPSALYLALGLDALAFAQAWPCAHYGLAVVTTALLLLAIRNEWDLITWIAPRAEPEDPHFGED